MSLLMEVLERAQAVADRLDSELNRVAAGLEQMDRLRSQLPLGLGHTLPKVSLSDPGRLRLAGADLQKVVPTWTPTCGALLSLQEAAAQWREIADNMAPPMDFVLLGTAVATMLTAVWGLIVAAQAFLAAWCAVNEAILAVSPWLLAAASAELGAALTAVLIPLAGLAISVVGVVAAAVVIQQYLKDVADRAAQSISKVASDLGDSTKWRAPSALPASDW